MDKIEELKGNILDALVKLNNNYRDIKVNIMIETLLRDGDIKKYYRIDAIYNDLNIRQFLPIDEVSYDGIIYEIMLRIHYEIIKYEGVK